MPRKAKPDPKNVLSKHSKSLYKQARTAGSTVAEIIDFEPSEVLFSNTGKRGGRNYEGGAKNRF